MFDDIIPRQALALPSENDRLVVVGFQQGFSFFRETFFFFIAGCKQRAKHTGFLEIYRGLYGK